MRFHPSLFLLQLPVRHHSQNGPAISKREKERGNERKKCTNDDVVNMLTC